MCGGRGGGDNGAAQRRASEDARQAGAIANVDGIFANAGRDALYDTMATDAKAKQLSGLARERDVASREVGFDLARRGLTGGSNQIDSEQELQRRMDEGLLMADSNAQQVRNQAQSNDERTRVNLINSIRSGMGEADAASAAFKGMSNNANAARDLSNSQSLTGMFDAIRGGINARNQNVATMDAFKKYRNDGFTGGGGSDGRIQKIPQ